MECTGRYHESMANALLQAGLFVSVVNPHLIKNFGNNSLRKVKSDPADAKKIARYTLDNWAELRQYSRINTYPVENTTFTIQLLYEAKGCCKSKPDCTAG